MQPAGSVSSCRIQTRKPMKNETISTIRVRYAETDQMGVVYHANYLVWCEIGRTDFIRSAARSYAEIEQDGVKLAVSEAGLRYLGSARYDDAILVHTRLTELRSRTLRFSYQIRSEATGRVLVNAFTSLVCVDEVGKPTRIPDSIAAQLAPTLSSEFTRNG